MAVSDTAITGEQQLRALLTPPPDVLSADQMTQLSRTTSLLNHVSEWITLSGQQITRLTQLPRHTTCNAVRSCCSN
uniref:Uncharacterized protein n=1 Tax=Escherichia coli TaxID=562 RepID=A0A6N0IEA8_ECOLX|nr:hypothetical protein HPE44_03550 [Escherichia coli]